MHLILECDKSSKRLGVFFHLAEPPLKNPGRRRDNRQLCDWGRLIRVKSTNGLVFFGCRYFKQLGENGDTNMRMGLVLGRMDNLQTPMLGIQSIYRSVGQPASLGWRFV